MALRFRVRAPVPSGRSDPGTVLERMVELPEELREIRIGRRAGLGLELPFPAISALHARLVRAAAGWIVEDLGSANGTSVGGVRLAPRVPQRLGPGAEILLADVSLYFEGDEAKPSPPSGPASPVAEGAPAPGAPIPGPAEPAVPRAESTGTIARRLVADLFQAPGAEVASLTVTAGPGLGRRLLLAQPERTYRVGRAPSCDLVLPDDDVSREHAAVERRWDGVHVRDLGSKNGVRRGEARLEGEQRLFDGDEVVLGESRLRLEDPEERYLARMRTEEQPAPNVAKEAVAPRSPVDAPAPTPLAGVPASPATPSAPEGPESAPAQASGATPSQDLAPPAAPAPARSAPAGRLQLVAGALALVLVLGVAAWLILSK